MRVYEPLDFVKNAYSYILVNTNTCIDNRYIRSYNGECQ